MSGSAVHYVMSLLWTAHHSLYPHVHNVSHENYRIQNYTPPVTDVNMYNIYAPCATHATYSKQLLCSEILHFHYYIMYV